MGVSRPGVRGLGRFYPLVSAENQRMDLLPLTLQQFIVKQLVYLKHITIHLYAVWFNISSLLFKNTIF